MPQNVDYNLLVEEYELALARRLADFPGEVASAATAPLNVLPLFA